MKQRVAQAFAARVAQGNLGHDVQVIYRVAGGMPSQRVEYEVAVDTVAGARVTAYEARASRTANHASIPPERLDVTGLFGQVNAGLHSLLPASRAASVPDALVGSITIRIDDDEETFYFVPEEEKRRRPGKGVAPSMDRALRRFWGIAKGVSEAQKDAKYE
jgi:hypothetical protein